MQNGENCRNGHIMPHVAGLYSNMADEMRFACDIVLCILCYYRSCPRQKTLEINPHHPFIKALKQRVSECRADLKSEKNLVRILLEAAAFRSGYLFPDAAAILPPLESRNSTISDTPVVENVSLGNSLCSFGSFYSQNQGLIWF